MFNSPEIAKIRFTNLQTDAGVDSYDAGMINTEAALEYDQVEGAGQGLSGMALLYHVFTEQWSKQALQGLPQATIQDFNNNQAFEEAHIYALAEEALATGLIRLGGGTVNIEGTNNSVSVSHFFDKDLNYKFSIIEGSESGSLEKLIRKESSMELNDLSEKQQEYGNSVSELLNSGDD